MRRSCSRSLATASQEDIKAARNVQDWSRHDRPPLSQLVPGPKAKGLPLRADFAQTIVLEILHNRNVHIEGTASKKCSHQKQTPRISKMRNSVMNYLCPSAPPLVDLTSPVQKIRKSHRKTTTFSNRDATTHTLMNCVAYKLHQLPNLEDGWVRTVCGWLSKTIPSSLFRR